MSKQMGCDVNTKALSTQNALQCMKSGSLMSNEPVEDFCFLTALLLAYMTPEKKHLGFKSWRLHHCGYFFLLFLFF